MMIVYAAIALLLADTGIYSISSFSLRSARARLECA